MSENTKIEWCDHTFNAWEGCQKAGPGCDHCYAETRNARFAGGTAINWGPGAPRRRTSPSNWAKPKRWNEQAAEFELHYGRRQRVFTLSLGDWVDNQVPIEWLVDLLELIRTTPRLDWLMLTKRIGIAVSRLQQAHAYVLEHWPAVDAQPLSWWLQKWLEEGNPPHNVWIGATVVNQAEADRDIPKLLEVPARVRMLSMEPLLGPVDLGAWIEPWNECGNCGASFDFEAGRPDECPECGKTGCMCTGFGSVLRREFDEADGRIEVPELPGINWVIVGGESGPGARPMHPDWARSLRDQCEAAGVPFLFKQWGEWGEPDSIERTGLAHNGWFEQDRLDGGVLRHEWPGPIKNGVELASLRPEVFRVGKKAAGRLLDGRTWDGFPS